MATEFQCTKTLDSTEREPCLYEYPPWEDANPLVVAENDLKRMSKERRVQMTEKLLSDLPPDDITIGTDGSAEGVRNGGSGCVVETLFFGTTIRSAAGSSAPTFQAELTAIETALSYKVELRPEHGSSIRLMNDSKSALEKLMSGPEHKDTQTGVRIWQLLNQLHRVVFVWVPSHCGLERNEHNDTQANKAARLPQDHRPITYQTTRAAVRRERKEADKNFYGKWKELTKISRTKKARNRREEVNVNQILTRETSLCQAILSRIGAADEPNCKDCGEIDTFDHLVTCQRGEAKRREIAGQEDSPDHFLRYTGDLLKLLRWWGRS